MSLGQSLQGYRQELGRSNPLNIRIILTSLVLAFTPLALADFVTVSRAYELEPDLVQVPVSPVSSLFFSNCEGCGTASGQLTANTQLKVDGQTVDFDEFCAAIRQAKQSAQSGIFLLHHLESNEIESVSVFL
jgi:hypothetical protein